MGCLSCYTFLDCSLLEIHVHVVVVQLLAQPNDLLTNFVHIDHHKGLMFSNEYGGPEVYPDDTHPSSGPTLALMIRHELSSGPTAALMGRNAPAVIETERASHT